MYAVQIEQNAKDKERHQSDLDIRIKRIEEVTAALEIQTTWDSALICTWQMCLSRLSWLSMHCNTVDLLYRRLPAGAHSIAPSCICIPGRACLVLPAAQAS